MKKIVLIYLIFIPTIIYSQKPKVDDIKLDLKDTDVIISYELHSNQDSTVSLDLILIDNNKNVYVPENIGGNIKNNIKQGKNTLNFDMTDQNFPLDRGLSPILILDRNIKNGPYVALFSLLVPGLGDYFVESPKNMIIKPYYRTIAASGFAILALMAHNNKPGSIYYESTNKEIINDGWWFDEGYVTKTYQRSNPNDYWLFRNDMEIFFGAAASIWIFDIFWVLTKGQQNQKIKSALKNKNYDFNLSATGFSLQVKLN